MGTTAADPGAPRSPRPELERPPAGAAAYAKLAARWLARHWPRIDARLYPEWIVFCVVWQGSAFVAAMLHQTGGVWSAPLDDVFIHFDYARSTARGYPFQWSEGNGYSSGNTSVAYPFVLALGYWVGFRELALVQWSLLVAFGFLLLFFWGAGRLVAPLGAWARYLVPPMVLSMGALGWSLWSGMENAMHLGVWGLAVLATLRAEQRTGSTRALVRASWLVGLVGALFVLVRPESAVCLASFGVFLAYRGRKLGLASMLRVLVAVGLFGVLALAALFVANRVYTGEWSQAGAIAKLALNDPYMPPEAKWDDWLGHFHYVFARNLHHHFSEKLPYGYLLVGLALAPLASRRLRAYAILLWVQVFAWSAVVALNGQVRWQNERYTMSAVAWLLVLAAMGVGALLSKPGVTLRARLAWGGRLAIAGLALALYVHHQIPRMRDQVWFYARASRNILDQHVRAGHELRRMGVRRVLVGDAGALLYASDVPGIDIIGLGGYRDFPFARAGRHGLGASIELIERLPARDRPEVMAIYPGWWGDLPIVFGEYLTEFPVVGNVICGGASKVFYRADWSALELLGRPRSLEPGELVVDELDVGDLLSERAKAYVFPRPRMGFVVWRVLPDPADASRDLFDAGRIIPQGQRESATLRLPSDGGRLVVRTTATSPSRTRVSVGDAVIGELAVEPAEGWTEVGIELPAGLPSEATITLEPVQGELVDHHLWTVARSGG